MTNTGVIAEQNGYYYYGPAFFKSDSTSRNLIIKQAWNETFTSYVGYSYESGGGSYPTISNNSQQSFSIYHIIYSSWRNIQNITVIIDLPL